MTQMKNHCEMKTVSRIAWIETINDRTAQIEKKAKDSGSELRIKIKKTEFENGDWKVRLHSGLWKEKKVILIFLYGVAVWKLNYSRVCQEWLFKGHPDSFNSNKTIFTCEEGKCWTIEKTIEKEIQLPIFQHLILFPNKMSKGK